MMGMTTRLTVVVDNVATGKFKGEWGLSLLLEYGVQKILVDCGASELFAANMEKLGLSIEEIDYGALLITSKTKLIDFEALVNFMLPPVALKVFPATFAVIAGFAT